ncbi:hypothetical protein SUGI_1096400 [Cryptomeria japonica]|nr:hypothetical protein SUGI_1096400 [Cryptomeria japonica]
MILKKMHPPLLTILTTMIMRIQILCSYVTLPLYALVTQLGTNMKTTIFDERIATALKKWHQREKKNIRQKRHDDLSSGQTTPYEGSSPIHLLRKYLSSGDLESAQNLGQVEYDIEEDAPSPSHHNANENSNEEIEEEKQDVQTLGFEFSFDHFQNENINNIIYASHKESESCKEGR